MIADVLHRFALLFETSPEIESRPFITRPRTMAAAWGGLLLCKMLSIALIDPTYGVHRLQRNRRCRRRRHAGALPPRAGPSKRIGRDTNARGRPNALTASPK